VILNSLGSPAAYFYCTSFSASTFPQGRPTHHVEDVTNHPALNWTLRFADGRSVPAQQAEVSTAFQGQSSAGGILHIYDPALPAGTYLVQAVLNGAIIDQARVRIEL